MSCKFVKFLALKGENVYNQVLWNKSRTVILMDGQMEDEMRNSVKKAAVTALVCVTAAGMMAGCGNKKLDGTKIAVTVNKQEIPFGVVSLAARMQQAQAEAMRLQLSHDEFDGLLADEHENTTEQNAEASPVAPVFEAPASRNAPCPCGSGLKYKQCHGRI